MRTGSGVYPWRTQCAGGKGWRTRLLASSGWTAAAEVLPGLEQGRPGQVLDGDRACHLLPVGLRETAVQVRAIGRAVDAQLAKTTRRNCLGNFANRQAPGAASGQRSN